MSLPSITAIFTGKNILTKANHFRLRSVSVRIRCCGFSARWKFPLENRNMTTPVACAANRSKLFAANTGLPIPAYSEVAIEGEVIPGTKIPEGPFGEFTGYYAGGHRSEPILKVKRLVYRNDPIITGAPPFRPAAGA